MAAEKKLKTCLCTLVWDMFSSVYPCYTAMWGNMTCVAMCYVTLWQSAHGLWQQVCMRCISQPLIFLYISLLPLSPSFPPSSFFLSNYRLLPLSLSSWSYLLFHSPAKQLPLPDSAPLRTAWLASFLSTIKVRDAQGFHGHFTMVAWTWAKSNLRVKPEHSSHFILLLLSYSIQKRYVNGKWLKGLFSVVKNYASNHAISSLFPAPH